jgi:outer membrane beta-barrel protein
MRTIRHRSRSLLIVALALVTSTASADKKGSAKPKPAPTAGGAAGSGAAKGGGDAGGEIEMDSSTAPAAKGSGAAADSGEIQMDDDANKPPADLSSDLAANDAATAKLDNGSVKKTPLSWKDIVVVIRKPFLKIRRTELNPFVATTMNDNMIRHEAIGGELAYWLTDVLAVGVEGQYYVHSFAEPFDLIARQARRLPTVNQYNWSTALDFHYVPVYGKFAVLDRKVVTWEAYFTAGIGVGQSEVVPRDKAFPGFTNLLIQPNVGASMRFFLAKWLTVNFGVRDYLFLDKFEPTNRSLMTNATAAEAQAHADSAFVNNIMFQIGLSFWLPTSFDYTTFR